MRNTGLVSGLLSIACALAGCGGATYAGRGRGLSQPSQPAAQFPSRSRLEQIAHAAPSSGAAPAPTSLWALPWTLEGPFPEADASAPVTPSTRLEILADRAAPAGVTINRASACSAREIARFLAVHPEIDIRVARFAVARCGSTAEEFWIEASRTAVDRRTDDAAFLATYGESLSRMARERMAGFAERGATHVGMHLARAEDGAAVAVLVGMREVLDLTTRAPMVQGDGIVLHGRLREPAQLVEAYVTFGPADFARCAAVPEVALPEIALRCPMHLGDTQARVEVMAFPPGRVLGNAVATVLLRRDAADTLPALAVDPSLATVAQTPALIEALLARANALRAQVGRAPLSLELAQSAMVQGLVPSWIDAAQGGRGEVADVIALGVIAGWDVAGGTIRDARLGATAVTSTRHPGEWLALLLEDPYARAVLLDAEVRGAALGVRWDPAQQAFVGALATYAFFESAELERQRQAAMRSLIAARAARGLPPPRFLGDVPGLVRASELVRLGRRAPGEALDSAMNETAQRTGRAVQALLLEGTNLEALAWPDELVRRPTLQLGVALTWHRVPGAAWGQYALMAIVID